MNIAKTLLLLLFVISGCTTVKSIPVNSQNKQNLLSGAYVYGHEVHSFTPCNTTDNYWVTNSDAMWSTLTTMYSEQTSEPYEQQFIVFEGRFLEKATDGFAADYDGLVHVDRLHTMTNMTPKSCASLILKPAE